VRKDPGISDIMAVLSFPLAAGWRTEELHQYHRRDSHCPNETWESKHSGE
jgi:hypothetical protein